MNHHGRGLAISMRLARQIPACGGSQVDLFPLQTWGGIGGIGQGQRLLIAEFDGNGQA